VGALGRHWVVRAEEHAKDDCLGDGNLRLQGSDAMAPDRAFESSAELPLCSKVTSYGQVCARRMRDSARTTMKRDIERAGAQRAPLTKARRRVEQLGSTHPGLGDACSPPTGHCRDCTYLSDFAYGTLSRAQVQRTEHGLRGTPPARSAASTAGREVLLPRGGAPPQPTASHR